MHKALSVILTPLFYLSFFLVLLTFHPLQWLAFNLFGYTAHERIVNYLNYFLTSTYRVLGTRIRFNGVSLPPDRTFIFVANHQSLLDIPVMIWNLRAYHPKFVSKLSLKNVWPSIGYNLRKSGAALIDRANSEQSIAEIERLGIFVKKHNFSVIIFPEGTRSRSGVLRPFALKGFSKIAEINNEALVVPVAISNSWKVLAKPFRLGVGEHLSWTVLDPISLKDGAADALRQAHEAIYACLSTKE